MSIQRSAKAMVFMVFLAIITCQLSYAQATNQGLDQSGIERAFGKKGNFTVGRVKSYFLHFSNSRNQNVILSSFV